MTGNIQQRFKEVQTEFVTTQKAMNELTRKQAELQTQLTRLNLVRQIEGHGVARTSPVWFVNGKGLQAHHV